MDQAHIGEIGTVYDKIWHRGKTTGWGNIVMQGAATLTANVSGNRIVGSVTNAYTKIINDSHYYLPITINVLSNNSVVAYSTTETSLNGVGSTNSLKDVTFSIDYNKATTLQVEYVCGEEGGCQQITYRPFAGSLYFGNPDTPPTNITGGAVYNTNGVQNGNDKLDWDFYVDWWGEAAGTHTISQYRLDLCTSTTGAAVTSIANVKKFTRYNFETLLPKCKVGETYYFYMNMQIDSSYWMPKVLIGSIKLYKDGIIYVKRYSDGAKIEATMIYNKYYTNGTKNKARYILVKDITGAKRIIDVYTTHYE